MRAKDYTKIDSIFEASLQLILMEGIAGLTMLKLAKKANIATGTLYIYFKNKEDLLHKLYLKLNKESVERFMKGYDKNEPFKQGFKTVWMNYLNHRLKHYGESVFLEQYYRSPFITKKQKSLAEAMKHPVYQMLRRGKAENIVKNEYGEEMLFLLLLGFIRELADEHTNGHYELNNEKIKKAFQLSWEAIII